MITLVDKVKYHITICGGLCRGRWARIKNMLSHKREDT